MESGQVSWIRFGGDLKSDWRKQPNAMALSVEHQPTMRMYVGNLSFNTTEQDLRSLFSEHGDVTDVHIPSDRETGQARGFAFVTMDSASAMEDAIKAVDGEEHDGRALKVNEARPREERG